MSIASRQVNNALNGIIETAIKSGQLPTVDYLIAQLSQFYQRVSVGFPSFRMRQQKYRSLWDVNSYNSNISEIYEDINDLYAEMISQFTVILQDFDYTDTERSRLLHDIKTLEDAIQNLTLLSTDTMGTLYSVFDNFTDRSKVDLQDSTVSIDTDARTCTIGESSGIVKVDMSKYYNVINFPIEATTQYSPNIISNTLMTGSQFGNAFNGTTSSWQQNIVTDVPGALQVSFIIDMSPDGINPVTISRIEIDGQSPNPMQVEPLWSVDNINFTDVPMGYSTDTDNLTVANGSTTIWNFSQVTARYLKFVVTKSIQDSQSTVNGSIVYNYVIGFKDISIYQMGYGTSSVLYSMPFTVTDPTGDPLTIDKASLLVDEDIQPGTAINYYFSLGGSGVIGPSGIVDPASFPWVPVSAINDPMPTQQQLVDFRQATTFNDVPNIQWNLGKYGTPLETYNGIPFYVVYTFPYTPTKNSVSIYRGLNDWQVTPQWGVSRQSIYDEEHTFGGSNSITLDNPNFTPVAGQGLIRGTVVVKSEPGQSPSYTYTTPGDYVVNYGTFQITKSQTSTIGGAARTSNTVYVDYQYDNETSLPSEYTTFAYVLNPNGTDVNLTPWSATLIAASGYYTTIETDGNSVDVSTQNNYHLSPGWHMVTTTAKPNTSADIFYSANNNQRLDQLVYTQYAFSTELQQVSWFDLKYNTSLIDHGKYAVTDYYGNGTQELIVNYRPQTASWTLGQDLLCNLTSSPGGQTNPPETYVISYKYMTTLTDTIYFQAVLSRDDTTVASATPTLNNYTIKLGY